VNVRNLSDLELEEIVNREMQLEPGDRSPVGAGAFAEQMRRMLLNGGPGAGDPAAAQTSEVADEFAQMLGSSLGFAPPTP
jgi:hypothetical protein